MSVNIGLINCNADIKISIEIKTIVEAIKSVLSTEKIDKQTFAILLHSEINHNLFILKTAEEDFDDYREMFKEISKKILNKELKACFDKKKGVGAKVLLEYDELKKEKIEMKKSKDDNIVLLNSMETVIDRISDLKTKAKTITYFTNKRSKPQDKIENLKEKLVTIKDFLEKNTL